MKKPIHIAFFQSQNLLFIGVWVFLCLFTNQVSILRAKTFEHDSVNKSLTKEQQPRNKQSMQAFKLFLSAMPELSEEGRKAISQNFEESLLMYRANKTEESTDRQLKTLCQFLKSRYLKQYVANSSLASTINSGEFDCLSGTALLAAAFHSEGFDYQVYETAHHVFLMVHLSAKRVLIECTDPTQMLVWNEKEISRRLQSYANETLTTETAEIKLVKPFCLPIALQQLAGLVLFNKAVACFNAQLFSKSIALLESAVLYYPSERCKELLAISQQLFRDFGDSPSAHLAKD